MVPGAPPTSMLVAVGSVDPPADLEPCRIRERFRVASLGPGARSPATEPLAQSQPLAQLQPLAQSQPLAQGSSVAALRPRGCRRARTSTTGVLLVAWLLTPSLGIVFNASPVEAQVNTDSLCQPTRAESLRPLVEALDRARRDGEAAEIRRLCVNLAEQLADATPDGAFAISSDRWLGPGTYMQELLGLIDSPLRGRVLETIDIAVTARLKERTATSDNPSLAAALDVEQLLRLDRDFPHLTWGSEARGSLASKLLEAGWIRAFGKTAPPELIAEFEELGRPPGGAPTWSPALDTPLRVIRWFDWRSSHDTRSPYSIPVEHIPAFDDSWLFLQDADRVTCLDRTTGLERWRTPFLVDPRETGSLFPAEGLPGSTLEPALLRGHVITSSRRAVTAFESASGNIAWEVHVAEFFGQVDGGAEELPPALCASAPVTSEAGTVVAVGQLREGTFELRGVLIGDDGTVLWNRPLATANGGTYVGLGSARPTVATDGTVAYFLSQRGLLSAHHLADGALLWAVRYPSFLDRGSRDAIQNQASLLNPGVRVLGGRVICAPADATSVTGFDADTGKLLFELPRGDARWWSVRESSRELALTGPRGVSVWSLGEAPPAVPTPAMRWRVPEGFPNVSGAAVSRESRWLVPHATGYYDVGLGSDWRIRLLRAEFPIQSVCLASSETLLVAGGDQAQLMAPHPPEDYQQAGFSSELLRARALLLQGEGLELSRAVDGLTSLPRSGQPGRATEELLDFAEECLEYAEYGALPLPEDQQLELVENLLNRLPRDGFFAQAAFDQAVAAARRTRATVAARMATLALKSPAGSIVQVTPHLIAPVELAVPRLLLALDSGDGYPGQEVHERAAQDSLDRARAADELQAYATIARLYPLTTAGRRAQLEAARKYFRQGNRQLAIETLQGLILVEPDSPESVDARLRLCEIYLSSQRLDEARDLLTVIESKFGDERITSEAGTERVADRVQRYRQELERVQLDRAVVRKLDGTQPLIPAWRTRTEFDHQRRVHVLPLAPSPTAGHGATENGSTDHRLLITAQRSVELRSARTGQTTWTAKLPAVQRLPEEHLFSSRGLLEPPVGVAHDIAVVTDRQTVWGLDLATGQSRWVVEPGRTAGGGGASGNPIAIETISMNDEIVLTCRPTGSLDFRLEDPAVPQRTLLRAFDTRTGRFLWEQVASDVPLGTPRFVAGQFLIAYRESVVAPPTGNAADLPRVMAELRSTADGRVLRRFSEPRENEAGRNPFGAELVQEPWFVGSHILLAQRSGTVRSLNAQDAVEAWRTDLPGTLVQVHFFEGVPFFVAELDRQLDSPDLVGVDPSTGRVLWTRNAPSRGGEIQQVSFHDGDLYVLENHVGSRRITVIQIPSVFLHPETWTVPPQTESLPTRTLHLGRTHDLPELRFDGDQILAVYRNLAKVIVVSRASRLVQVDRYEAMERFLNDPSYLQFSRKTIHFADFVGDTLVLLTSRGGIGLRAKSRTEFFGDLWEALLEFDPLDEGERTPVGGAICAYRYGDVEAACSIVEEHLARPGLLPATRRSLTGLLEGFAQEQGEAHPPTYIVPRLASVPRIDGSLDEDWHAQTAIPVRAARYFHPVQGFYEDAASWRGWQDLSATVYLGWTNEGFHLAVDVIDDHVHAYDRDAQRWIGDCLLISVDFEGDRGQMAGQNDQLFTLALTVPKQAPPPGPDGAPPPADPLDEEDEPEGQYQVQRKRDGSGVVYEMTIPWSVFRNARREKAPSAPYPDLEFSLNLLLTDDDTGRGASSFLTLSPGQLLREETRGIWEVFIPDFFPRLILSR